MDHKETPQTMKRFLEIITAKKPHVMIEGPSRALVSIKRKTAQRLFLDSAENGYKTTLKWTDGKAIVVLEVVNA